MTPLILRTRSSLEGRSQGRWKIASREVQIYRHRTGASIFVFMVIVEDTGTSSTETPVAVAVTFDIDRNLFFVSAEARVMGNPTVQVQIRQEAIVGWVLGVGGLVGLGSEWSCGFDFHSVLIVKEGSRGFDFRFIWLWQRCRVFHKRRYLIISLLASETQISWYLRIDSS